MLAHGPICIRAKGCLPLRGSAFALASDAARHVRAYARPAVCIRDLAPEREVARVPSRAYAANEISRLPIGRARHLCAPIRDRAHGAPARVLCRDGARSRGRVRPCELL